MYGCVVLGVTQGVALLFSELDGSFRCKRKRAPPPKKKKEKRKQQQQQPLCLRHSLLNLSLPSFSVQIKQLRSATT